MAFDILFDEGQRRYLESLNAYARQFVQPARAPDVDAVFGIPPTVAIEQRTSRGGRKSTVATLTESTTSCACCSSSSAPSTAPTATSPIEPQTAEAIVAQLLRAHRGRDITLLAPLVVARKGYYTDLAKWAAARASSACASTASMLPTDAGRASTASASTTSSCRWRASRSTRRR